MFKQLVNGYAVAPSRAIDIRSLEQIVGANAKSILAMGTPHQIYKGCVTFPYKADVKEVKAVIRPNDVKQASVILEMKFSGVTLARHSVHPPSWVGDTSVCDAFIKTNTRKHHKTPESPSSALAQVRAVREGILADIAQHHDISLSGTFDAVSAAVIALAKVAKIVPSVIQHGAIGEAQLYDMSDCSPRRGIIINPAQGWFGIVGENKPVVLAGCDYVDDVVHIPYTSPESLAKQLALVTFK